MNQYEVKFMYRDELSHGKWNEQVGVFYGRDEYEARKKCVECYGLDSCEYKIVSVNVIP